MRYTSYRFLDITQLPPEIEEQVLAAVQTGTIRLVQQAAGDKQYVDGRELHKILGLEHGIAGYVNAD